MDSGDKSTQVSDRIRYLNIVYFIESARSHTLRINLRHAKWGVGLAVILCAWSIGSIIWILSLKREVDGTRHHLESALTTVFDYQIKNDKVFELAYPIDATNGYYSEAAQLASNNPIVDKRPATSESAPIANESKPVTNEPPLPSQALATDVATKAKPVKEASSKKIIGITAPRISKSGVKMTLDFNITNSHTKKAEGYIWAVASIQTPAGQTTQIIAPEHAKLDNESGKISVIKAAYRFSIQRFKEKSFDFTIPAGIKDWKLTKLTVSFTDLNANETNQVELPVESLALNQDSDTPPTELKL